MRATAAIASLTVFTRKPFFPFSISSGMLPLLKAITGVPQAIDSITERPKGSSKFIGCRSAVALPRS